MIGTVIHGTHRNEDLIPAFIEKLSELLEASTFNEGADVPERVAFVDEMQDNLGEIERRMETPEYFGSEDAAEDLAQLFEWIDLYFAPEFCYFGAHEGDGSDFGFWPNHEALRDHAVSISDPVELDTIEEDQALFVNDHGNMTLYLRKDGEWHTEWEVV